MIYSLTKKLVYSFIIFVATNMFFVSADMTKQQACKLIDGAYDNTNLVTVWKPYIDYNKTVKYSFQKKNLDVNGFYKSDGFLYYIANYQVQDMTYTFRSNLFSYNCKKNSIKQLSTMSFGKGSYFESRVIYGDGLEFLMFNQYENPQDSYYSIFSKKNITNTKIDIKIFKNFNLIYTKTSLINPKLSSGNSKSVCNNYDQIVIDSTWKGYIECSSTDLGTGDSVKLKIDIKNKEFLFDYST